MAVPSVSYTTITDARVDANSPFIEELSFDIRDNLDHLKEVVYGSFAAETEHNHDGINSAPVQQTEAVKVTAQENGMKRFDDGGTGADPVTWDASYSGVGAEFASDDDLMRIGDFNSGTDDALLRSTLRVPFMRHAWRLIVVAAIQNWADFDAWEIGFRGVASADKFAEFRKGTNSNTFAVAARQETADSELLLDNQAMTYGTDYDDLHEFRIDVFGFQDVGAGLKRNNDFYFDGSLVKSWSFDDAADATFGMVTGSHADVRLHFNSNASASNERIYIDKVTLQPIASIAKSGVLNMSSTGGTWHN